MLALSTCIENVADCAGGIIKVLPGRPPPNIPTAFSSHIPRIVMTQTSLGISVIDITSALPGEAELKLLVLGFDLQERQLLDAIIRLSQRRQPKIHLLSVDDGEHADVVMIDGADPEARQWADKHTWLQHKVIIWVDASDAPNQNVVRRPVQWVTLPMMLACALEKSLVRKQEILATVSGHGSVLIVDDSVAVRAQLRPLLELRGLTVTEVDSAEAAIKAASASFYTCILMDVFMSGIDGYEACRKIRANMHGDNSPAIVMLTSRSSPFDRIRGKMAGCDAYLTKPINPDRLYEAISRFIEKNNREAQRAMPPMSNKLSPTT